MGNSLTSLRLTHPPTPSDVASIPTQETCYSLILEIISNHEKRRLLSAGTRADTQLIINFLSQILNHADNIDQRDERRILHFLAKLVKEKQRFPQQLQIKGVQCDLSRHTTEGGYGYIYKARYKRQTVCVKAVHPYGSKEKQEKKLRAHAGEVIIWAHLSHQNIVPFHGIYMSDEKAPRVCLVSRWMTHGDLLEFLEKFPDSPRIPLLHDIILGLSYLHRLFIVHADLKAKNVLVSQQRRAMLADFGVSRLLMTTTTTTQNIGAGTTNWMAPELFPADDKTPTPTSESDIWAFGCTSYEVERHQLFCGMTEQFAKIVAQVLTGETPFYQYKLPAQVINAVTRGYLPLRPEDANTWDPSKETIWKIAESCWKSKPGDRPSTIDLENDLSALNSSDERLVDAPIEKTKKTGKTIDYTQVYHLLQEIRSSRGVSPAKSIASQSVLRSEPQVSKSESALPTKPNNILDPFPEHLPPAITTEDLSSQLETHHAVNAYAAQPEHVVDAGNSERASLENDPPHSQPVNKRSSMNLDSKGRLVHSAQRTTSESKPVADPVAIQHYPTSHLTEQLDNHRSTLDIADQLDRLVNKEKRWDCVEPVFTKTNVNIPFSASGIYELTGGVFLLGESSRKALHYMYLPSMPDEEVMWKEVRTKHTIIDAGLCVHEHDLLAIVITQSVESVPLTGSAPPSNHGHEIQLILHQVSTGQLYPEAQQPIIPVVITRWENPWVEIQIVGNNLVLILAYYENPFKPDDQVFVYNWKTATLKMKWTAPYQSYSGFLFLTEGIILLPNKNTGNFEFFKIPHNITDPITPQPFFSLSLPKLAAYKRFFHISCHANPNPTSTVHRNSKPFRADPFHAIAMFTIQVCPVNPLDSFSLSSSFALFVHRSSLVKCLEKFPDTISDTGNIKPVSYSIWGPDVCRWFSMDAFSTRWITTTAGQRCVMSWDINLEVQHTPIILLNFNQKDVARVLEDEARDYREKEKRHELRDKPAQLQRQGITVNTEDELDEYSSSEKGRSARTRAAVKEGDKDYSEEGDDWVSILSNNSDNWDPPPHQKKETHKRGRVMAMVRPDDPIPDKNNAFQEIEHSSLPYTICSSENNYLFDGVLINEERIIGLKEDSMRVKMLDILHFG